MSTPQLSQLTDDLVHHGAPQQAEWWRKAVIYQVYPRSFADGNADGMGDLPGITSRLDHLVALGVDALWMSPFYTSPQADGGYDVADYRDIDPLFGTLDDFDALLTRAHALGLKVIVDVVPNHTSDQHAWFQEALHAGPGSTERARYLFRDGKGADGKLPPNNWESIFGGPAWTRVDQRSAAQDDGITDTEWYLHMFDTTQPDLDWSNPQVHTEFEDVLRFWLDRGVDGFRIDVAHGMVKQPGLPDWDGSASMVEGSTDSGDGTAEGAGNSGPMFDQDGVHDIYRDWHKVLAEYPGDRALVAEAWVQPMSRLARYVRPDEMHQAFNFAYLVTPWGAPAMRDVITESLTVSDAVGAPTTWVLSNHDVVRHASRLGLTELGKGPNGIHKDDQQPDAVLGLRRARAATLQMLALPGSAYLYQGEELGLPEHTTLDDSMRQDPAWWRSGYTEAGRDGCRVPMPWEADQPGYGFGASDQTWLPQPASYGPLAADQQRGAPESTYEMYRAALSKRRTHELGTGTLGWVSEYANSPDVLAFVNGDVLVLTNYAATPVPVPAGLTVVLSSGPLADAGVPSDTTIWATAGGQST